MYKHCLVTQTYLEKLLVGQKMSASLRLCELLVV